MSDCTMCGKPMGSERGAFHSNHVPGSKKSPSLRQVKASTLGGKCPLCGGTDFKAVRSTKRKLALGLASLLTSPNEVQCVACGQKFKRG